MGSVKPSEVATEQVQVDSQIAGKAARQPPAGTGAEKTKRHSSPGLVTLPTPESSRTCVPRGRRSPRAGAAAPPPPGKAGLRPESAEAESSPAQGGVGLGGPWRGCHA